MILKVCGMKDPENMKALAKAGPDLMGLIFYERSPRFFKGPLPEIKGEMKLAGVFVNAPLEDIIEKVGEYNLNFIQLHGEESPEYLKALKHKLIDLQLPTRLIKVCSVATAKDLASIKPYEGLADLFLFDTKGRYRGGNGIRFDWKLLENYTGSTPYLLSGGIAPDDAGDIVKFLHTAEGQNCAGLDVNSGFETEPGYKDIGLIKEFKNKINREFPEKNSISL